MKNEKIKLVDFFLRETRPNIKMLINECINIDRSLKSNDTFAFEKVKKDFKDEWTPPVIPIEGLLSMPEKSIGRELAVHLLNMNKDQEPIHSMPATARFKIIFPVKKENYVRDRIRQTHDILHILTNFNTGQPGELALQGFYFGQKTNLLSVLFLINTITGYFMGIQDRVYIEAMLDGIRIGLNARSGSTFEHFEEAMETNIEELRSRLSIMPSYGNQWNRC